MALERKEIFEFGEFRLDVEEHTIERIDGAPTGTLTEKAFQALVLLVQRGGHLVLKDELMRFVWPDSIVEDNNLEKCVHHLRHFLGETNGRKYIETVRKHGYRFVEKVEKVEVSSSWLPEAFRTFDVAKESPHLTADHLPELKAKGEMAVGSRQAGVEKTRYSFRRVVVLSGIFLILIGVMTGLGYYLFIRPRLEPNAVEFQAKHGTNNAEAYQLYMMAMNLSEERGAQNVQRSVEYLDRAVALDPNFALAWAAKALAPGDQAVGRDLNAHEYFRKSMEAIEKALAIDPDLSEAYSALCNKKNRYDYDFIGAETACKRALELDPNSPVAHKTYANFLFSRGRFDESISEIKTAMDLQPVSYRNQQIYALTLYYARRYDEAAEQFRRLIELNPNHSIFIQDRLIKVLEAQGKESEAFENLVKMLTVKKTETYELERMKSAYQASGWRGVLAEEIRTGEADAGANYYQLACLYAKIGNKDNAFEYLEKAFQVRDGQIPILQIDPELDSLRNDPRFADLIRRAYGNRSSA